jgi:hypothetical protein
MSTKIGTARASDVNLSLTPTEPLACASIIWVGPGARLLLSLAMYLALLHCYLEHGEFVR